MEVEKLTNIMMIIILVQNIWHNYLNFRQIRLCHRKRVVPPNFTEIVEPGTYQIARSYAIDKKVYGIWRSILADVLYGIFELYTGLIGILWQQSKNFCIVLKLDPANEIYVSCIFILMCNTIAFIKDLTFKVYYTFWIEEFYGFNKQTWRFFIWDQLKKYIVLHAVLLPLAASAVYIVKMSGKNFFISLWLFTAFINLVFVAIYPNLIAPMFDKYRPLDNDALYKSIEELANKLNFPLSKVYVVENSKRSKHSNAFYYGMCNTKRIVLYDTLLVNKGMSDDSQLQENEKGRGCTNEEIIAVLAHEIGYWELNHTTKNLILVHIYIMLIYWVFQKLFQYDDIYTAVGLPKGEHPVLIGLIVVAIFLFGCFNDLMNLYLTKLSRKFEYLADEFAHNLGLGDDLEKALIKLNADNLGFPLHDWLYSSWNHSHPTLLQRIDRLKSLRKTQ